MRRAAILTIAVALALACGGIKEKPAFTAVAAKADITGTVDKPTFGAISLANTGKASDTLELDIDQALTSVPETWIVSLCDTSGVCFPLPHRVPLEAGAKIESRGVDVLADTAGAGSVSVVVRSVTDTTVRDTVTFRVVVN